jgi:hypothetical protein
METLWLSWPECDDLVSSLLSDSEVEETENIRSCELEASKSGTLGAFKPIGQEERN